MPEFGMGFIPIGVRAVGKNEFELVDHSQSMNMMLFNESAVPLKVKLFVDGVHKNDYTLGPASEDERERGGDGSSQIFEPIIVCIPQMKNLETTPMVVFFDEPTRWKTIRGEFTTPNGDTLALEIKVRFAEKSQPWSTVVG